MSDPSNNHAISVYKEIGDPLAYAEKVGTWLFKSGVFKGIKSPEAGQYIALQCRFEGITPEEFRRTYHMVDGQPSMRADAMLANFRTKYGGSHRKIEKSPKRAAIEFSFEGRTWTAEYTWDQAKDSRWPYVNWGKDDQRIKDNWATDDDKKKMLWARLISDELRSVVPEMVAGMYSTEEMIDLVAEREPSAETDIIDGAVVESVAEDEPDFTPVTEKNLLLQARVEQLLDELAIDEAKRKTILSKRNCTEVSDLTPDQCTELIEKLEIKLQQVKVQGA